MSSDNSEADSSCCASCGIAEVDDIKLKECIHCDLVKYCSDGCQREHNSQHEEACKIRVAELRDELLFKQPESTHLGDCPICMIPLPFDPTKSTVMSCCSKIICNGCNYANQIREFEAKMKHKCPFCRESAPKTDEEADKLRMKRMKMNDPLALTRQGGIHYEKGDYSGAFDYYTKAAELGDVNAHYDLSCLYQTGRGIEKDRGKEMYHLEEAAIGGHPYARHQLGRNEGSSGNGDRAVKHWIIAARQGEHHSMKALLLLFKKGFVNKEFLEVTLRAHQAAVDATKSPQREAVEKIHDK